MNTRNSSVLIDTGFIFALICKTDEYHKQAKIEAEKHGFKKWITTIFVFQEIIWLLERENMYHSIPGLFELIKDDTLNIEMLKKEDLLKIEEILKKYSDRNIDLADASLILLAEKFGHGDILSVDVKDFSVYRWHQTKSFNILLTPRRKQAK